MHGGLEDTICAIATPAGEGGIGIVRLSGSQVACCRFPSCSVAVWSSPLIGSPLILCILPIL